MPIAPTELFAALADPTRRAIFERLARDGEQTVRVLTGHAGNYQGANYGWQKYFAGLEQVAAGVR
jgi:DNA-binding transcriptional ArsR family regulator